MKKLDLIPDQSLSGRITRLRGLLSTGEDLCAASDYFHEALVSDDTFMKSGSCQDNPRLITILTGVLKAIAPRGELGCPMVVGVPKFRMCHGCALWGRGMALFFYFEELDLGLCSYQHRLSDPHVCFARFSVVSDNGWMPGRHRASA